MLKTTPCILTLALAAGAVQADLLNELSPNPDGVDPPTQTIELLGTPDASFDLWFLEIESDLQASMGTIDRAEPMVGTYDANGIATIEIADLENPSSTYMLTSGFDINNLGIDNDADDDGILDDISLLGTVMDAVGHFDAPEDFVDYAGQVGGVALAFSASLGDGEAELLFRDRVTLDWYASDVGIPGLADANGNDVDPNLFDLDPFTASFGSANPTLIPEPAMISLFGLAGIAALARRR